MPNRDILDNIKVIRAISPQTQTNADTALVSAIIDTQGFDSMAFFISTGGLTDVDATFATTMEEGDSSTLADTAAVAAGDLLSGTRGTAAYTAASFKFSDDDVVFRIGYIGRRRYVRLTVTPTGNNSGAAPLSVVAVLANPDFRGVGITTATYTGP